MIDGQLKKVIEERLRSAYSKASVNALTESFVTDYERGRMRGRIETLEQLAREWENTDNASNTVSTKVSSKS